MRPVIGVLPLWSEDPESWHKMKTYMGSMEDAGGEPVAIAKIKTMEEAENAVAACDGILFTGGQDVDPVIYHQEILNDSVKTCPERDALESLVLEAAMKQNKPILGICRGIQFINAYLGGTLYQDLPTEYAEAVNHRQTNPSDEPSHGISVLKNSPMYALLGVDSFKVNSFHHQAVKKIAPGFLPMAVSEDGVIEAIYHSDKAFLWAVQWHPERTYSNLSHDRILLKSFIEAAKEKK